MDYKTYIVATVVVFFTWGFLALIFAQSKMDLSVVILNPTQVGYSFVVDSSYLDVNLSNGTLPRRANGTYLYWKADANGDLMPVIRFKYLETMIAKPKYTVMGL